MKVVHLVPALEQGGVESVVCNLNSILVKAGWDSVVMSSGGRLRERIEIGGGRHVTIDLKSKNPFTYFFRARKLRLALQREKPDLVCVHSRVPAWLFVWANRKLGLKWISYAHGANSVSKYSEIMTKGDLIITPSQFLAEYLMDNYHTAEKKIRVIPNAVDVDRFNPDRVDQAVIAEKRRAWGIRDGDHVIMAIGRISPVKGLDDLIRSTPPNVKLVIVGGADRHHLEYERRLRAMAGKNVVFAGPQEKIPECISIADEIVSANTTKPESFGLSIIEAYAMNKPVRAKRFGGAAEVMDAVEKAGAVTFREAVVSLYGVDKFAERTVAAYRELINVV